MIKMPYILTQMLFSVVLIGSVVLFQCSTERDISTLLGSTSEGTIVVDAVLYVDRPMPEIIVSRTQSPESMPNDEHTGLNGANVTVSQGLVTYQYRSTGNSGVYVPPEGAPSVLPETVYQLFIQVIGQEVRGSSTTPGRLSLNEVVILDEGTQGKLAQLDLPSPENNRVVYQEGLIEARFDPLEVDGYQVIVLEKSTGDTISSPPLEAPGGRLRLPWFALGSSGQHEIGLYALDRNMFDVVRSIPRGENGFGIGSLAGDNFDRPIFNLQGAIGVFGSASVGSFGFEVLSKDVN